MSTVVRSLSPPRGTGSARTLVGSTLYFVVCFALWALPGALGAYIAADLGLGPAEVGIMVAVPPLSGSLLRLVVGQWSDRIGERRIGIITLLACVVPLGWGWLDGDTLFQMLGIGLLLGFAGATFAVAIPLVSRWYPPDRQGLILGVVALGNAGTALAALAAPRLAEKIGWHAVFGWALLPLAIATAAFIVLVRQPPHGSRSSASLRSLWAEPDARQLSLLYAATFGGFVGLAAYLPSLLVDGFGLAKVTAASYAAVGALAGSLLRPVGGAAADRLGATRVLIGVCGGATTLAVTIAATPGVVPTILLMIGLMGLLGIGSGAVFQIVPLRFPDSVGTATGLVGAAGGLGGFLLPLVLGIVYEVSGSLALALLALGAGPAMALWSLVSRRRTRVTVSTT